MPEWLKETEEMVYSGRIKVPYTWWVGETGTDFFNALKDEKKILGRYCPGCDLVFVPPRKTCGRCFTQDMQWRELGTQGTLTTYTIPRVRQDIHPLEPPFAYGIIKLDGADTGLTHLLAEFKEGGLKSGMRVEAVFREEPTGGLLDIRYFRPAAG
ncbi:MAG: Zn-ribbon domain-containing OB-fold protein [Pseudomonadota bacterium]